MSIFKRLLKLEEITLRSLALDKETQKFSYTILYTNLLFILFYSYAVFIVVLFVIDASLLVLKGPNTNLITSNIAFFDALFDYLLILAGLVFGNQGLYQFREYRKKFYIQKNDK